MENEFWDRWTKKLHKLSIKDRNNLFDKINSKYHSEKYKDREYSLGREPNEYLYGLILEYGRRYGKEITDDPEIEFIYETYILDNNWEISCIYGQGCCYRLQKRES